MNNRKSIWIMSHYSADPRYNPGYRFYNWAKELVKRGYAVTIFCASSIHGTDINLCDENDTYEYDLEENIKYVYVKCKSYKSNGIKRVLNMLEFSKKLNKIYKKYPKPELIIARLPHIWCGKVGLKASKYFGVPLICDIADIWPDGFIEHMNVSKKNPFVTYYKHYEKKMYKRANALIFSMEGGKELISDRKWKIDFEKVFHINMGVDLPIFDENANNSKMSYDELFDDSLFKVTYCGSIRLINNVDTLCKAAKLLQDKGENDIFFSIHGFGIEEDMLKQYCRENKLNNIKFFGKINKNDIPFVLEHSDVNVLSYHETPLYKYGGSMSKMFEAFAAGKPILATLHMGYSLIERYSCGLESDNNPQAVADAILKLKNMSIAERNQLGKNARQCALDYDQPMLVDKLEEVFSYVGVKKNE